MNILAKLIKEVEDHVGKPFDLSIHRHAFQLNAKIQRLHEDELRRLDLIEKAIKSENREDSIYCNSLQYTRNR